MLNLCFSLRAACHVCLRNGLNVGYFPFSKRTPLLRINSDEYGSCFVCGEDIDLNRLMFDPTVTRCINCS
ncbi:TraR/DksA family transcriptional regulator [Shewanella baltica]|uniref:TraR/DksA family transcriptional regulator n=1 Tax=Shewanella baltica TaxID=62322 RepID=UPI003D7B3078